MATRVFITRIAESKEGVLIFVLLVLIIVDFGGVAIKMVETVLVWRLRLRGLEEGYHPTNRVRRDNRIHESRGVMRVSSGRKVCGYERLKTCRDTSMVRVSFISRV